MIINISVIIIFVVGETSDGYEISCYRNVYLDNYSTFDEYWDSVKDHVKNLYEETSNNQTDSYHLVDHISHFNVKVWNMDIKSKINISGYCNRLFIIQFKYFYSY